MSQIRGVWLCTWWPPARGSPWSPAPAAGGPPHPPAPAAGPPPDSPDPCVIKALCRITVSLGCSITYRSGCNYLTSVALDPWISALSSGSPPLSLLRAVIQELRSLNSPMAVSRVELASEAAMAQQMYSRGDGRAATAQDGANTPPQYIGQIWYQSQVRKWRVEWWRSDC